MGILLLSNSKSYRYLNYLLPNYKTKEVRNKMIKKTYQLRKKGTASPF